MSIENIIKLAMKKSGGAAELTDVPKDKKLTNESLNKLENEVTAQVDRNRAMRNRSMHNAESLSQPTKASKSFYRKG